MPWRDLIRKHWVDLLIAAAVGATIGAGVALFEYHFANQPVPPLGHGSLGMTAPAGARGARA